VTEYRRLSRHFDMRANQLLRPTDVGPSTVAMKRRFIPGGPPSAIVPRSSYAIEMEIVITLPFREGMTRPRKWRIIPFSGPSLERGTVLARSLGPGEMLVDTGAQPLFHVLYQ
jgi:hypothetical protein